MYYLLVTFLGWLSGAIVNYFSDVLPRRRHISRPFCLQCNSPQPSLNYLFWPRRCSNCGARRPLRTWIVEIIYICLSFYLALTPPNELVYLLSLLLLTYFGIVTVIDLEHRLILHPVSLVGALLGFAIGVGLHGLRSTLLGGAAGYGIMLLLYFLGIVFIRFITRWRAQEIDEVALGFGDVNLGGVIGLILGWPGIIAGLLLAILLGGFTSLLYLLAMALRRKYRPDLVLPYGPFMVISTVWLLFFRDVLLL